MEFDLIVTIAFADYAVGDRITDPKIVADNIDSPFVVRIVKSPAKSAK